MTPCLTSTWQRDCNTISKATNRFISVHNKSKLNDSNSSYFLVKQASSIILRAKPKTPEKHTTTKNKRLHKAKRWRTFNIVLAPVSTSDRDTFFILSMRLILAVYCDCKRLRLEFVSCICCLYLVYQYAIRVDRKLRTCLRVSQSCSLSSPANLKRGAQFFFSNSSIAWSLLAIHNHRLLFTVVRTSMILLVKTKDDTK